MHRVVVGMDGSPAAAAALGGYPVTVRHGYGHAAPELVGACADADLLVIGSRGRGPVTGLVLGSVSRACLAHASCPVVVVRPQPEQARSHGRVLVGVDLSGHCSQALRVAAEEARKQLLEWGRTLVAGEIASAGVAGRPVVVHGHAPEVLVRHSARADLLVVGSRGHNPVTGLLLGSTSEQCARRAHCPVMVTHAGGVRERATGGPAKGFLHPEVT